ncbi:hypothetical protein P5G65_25455 [Paenibacillus chondroitinus]|uniref:Uncharacterized protein n=1 Tax=Paenibacillus chondroitinus TaxID=59842 RepID=A0ABU6DIR6_9BACL|nr:MULTISPECIES: hypothetical protein [Paenibacillus]MCY9662728.1 hypothetical protein [Paenibacillus anseongense]MEB4797255.1 hypothetical protein [Paenibacillus chondroitinus]
MEGGIDQFGDPVNVIATDGEALVQIMHQSASMEEAVQWGLNDIGVKSENLNHNEFARSTQ